MRRLAFLVCLLLLSQVTSLATSALVFDGGDYYIEIVVGQDDQAVVGQVLLIPPGQKRPVSLPREQIQVVRFDTRSQVLEIRYTNTGDAKLPSSFCLSVDKDAGVLRMDGKRIQGKFEWTM